MTTERLIAKGQEKPGKIRDQIKKGYCQEHGICLEEITYREDIKVRLIEILDTLYQNASSN
jgi:hypothetical protein